MKTPVVNTLKVAVMLTLISTFTSAQAQTVMQTLKEHQETTNFAQALETTDISEQLNGDGPYTLFAPSNDAFTRLSSSQQSNSSLLLNHIFTGMATERSLKAMSDITCLSGRTISIENQSNRLTVNSHEIMISNIRANNGVIHVINGIIE